MAEKRQAPTIAQGGPLQLAYEEVPVLRQIGI